MADTKGGTAPRTIRLATRKGERRLFRLEDGSSALLEPDSRLALSFDGRERSLRLTQGRGRFDVAHEPRPFIVYAGGGSVTAHGTVFDVAIDPDRQVMVRLLRGAIDVALPADIRSVRRLQPGEQVRFAARDIASVVVRLVPSADPAAAIAALGEFDDVKLSDLVTDANRHGGPPLRLADPSLGALRVSGRFSLTDPGKLAERVAVLQDLAVDRSDPNQITLRRR